LNLQGDDFEFFSPHDLCCQSTASRTTESLKRSEGCLGPAGRAIDHHRNFLDDELRTFQRGALTGYLI